MMRRNALTSAAAVISGVVLVGMAPSALAFPGVNPASCDNDYGVQKLGEKMNARLYEALVAAREAQKSALVAVGKKKEADELGKQLEDLDEESAPRGAEALKSLDDSTASLKKTLASAKAEDLAKKGKKLVGAARESITLSRFQMVIGGVYAGPIGKKAKKAIEENKACSKKLKPIADAAAKYPDAVENVQKADGAIEEFATKAGLDPMKKKDEKKLLKKVSVPDEMDESTLVDDGTGEENEDKGEGDDEKEES